MPEGDTIHRAAHTLNLALAGQIVTSFASVFPALLRRDEDHPLVGRVVERVYALGKNLLMQFSGDLFLRTHMRMHGSWHIYKPGERWQRPRDEMRIVIETPAWVAVAFAVPVAEFHSAASLQQQEDVRLIGPDFAAETFDFDEAKRRVQARPTEEIADVLLNQRVVAGLGNEYKSEVLFMAKVHPFALVQAVPELALTKVLETGRKLMLANTAPGARGRVTTFSLDPRQAQYVYERSGKPCRRCGARIHFARQGPNARVTFWCEPCQSTGAPAR